MTTVRSYATKETPGQSAWGFLSLRTTRKVGNGYLWFPVAGGFVSLSLYDTQAAANASTGAAKVWVAEHLAAYTDGNPEVINATVAYADMPIFQV